MGFSKGQARSTVLWTMVAFLFGFALFGLFISLFLLQKNQVQKQDFEQQLDDLRLDLEKTRGSLEIAESARTDLENDLVVLRSTLVSKEKALTRALKSLEALEEKAQELLKSQQELQDNNLEMRDFSLRLQLENLELKKRLSSVQDLKEAIRMLKKRKVSVGRSKKKASTFFTIPASSEKQKSQPLLLKAVKREEEPSGNEGFVVRDGRTTLGDRVEIRVAPAEAAVL